MFVRAKSTTSHNTTAILLCFFEFRPAYPSTSVKKSRNASVRTHVTLCSNYAASVFDSATNLFRIGKRKKRQTSSLHKESLENPSSKRGQEEPRFFSGIGYINSILIHVHDSCFDLVVIHLVWGLWLFCVPPTAFTFLSHFFFPFFFLIP